MAIGIGLAGIAGMVYPDLVKESAPALILPTWLYFLFNCIWAAGGTFAAWGLMRGLVRLEVPGLALMSGGLGAYYMAVITARGWSGAIAGLFIGSLALGCAIRSFHLFHYGYDGNVPDVSELTAEEVRELQERSE